MVDEYDHNELVREVYHQLKEDFQDAELIARKGDSEVKLGKFSVDRRHFDGEGGAPDLVIDIDEFELLGADFFTRFPFALIEIETNTDAALSDLENYVEQDGRSSPVIIISEDEKMYDREEFEEGHRFRITSVPYDEIDE